jgi:hypothetical protein
LNRAFSKEEFQVTKKIHEEMLNNLAIKEMQIKIRLRFHLTPVSMATVKTINNSKCWRECGRKRTLTPCW